MEDVFVANGFEREKVQEYMKESKREDDIEIRQKSRNIEVWWLYLMYVAYRNSSND